MQTVETPSEQPEREFAEPLPVINERALLGNGFYIMRRMYNEPFKAYMFFSDWLNYQQLVEKVAELCSLGYVAVDSTSSGFQLTANGRLMFHDLLERMAHEETLCYEQRSKTAPVQNDFDLAHLDGENRGRQFF